MYVRESVTDTARSGVVTSANKVTFSPAVDLSVSEITQKVGGEF